VEGVVDQAGHGGLGFGFRLGRGQELGNGAVGAVKVAV
jgi:hypothetical protein